MAVLDKISIGRKVNDSDVTHSKVVVDTVVTDNEPITFITGKPFNSTF